jgi:hypothetical protein
MKSWRTLSLIGQLSALSLSSHPPICDFSRGCTIFLLTSFLDVLFFTVSVFLDENAGSSLKRRQVRAKDVLSKLFIKLGVYT